MSSLGIHRRDHAIFGHPSSDPKHSIVALLQVLPDHRRHELRRLHDLDSKRAPVEYSQHRVGIARQFIHERLAGGRIIPIARRLTGCDVIVVAFAARAQLDAEFLVDDPE